MNDLSKTHTSNKSAGKIVFILALLIFSYTLARAYLLSFTWDESFSYLQYVRNGILFPEKYEMMDANNHLLNTWLNIHLVKYFGVSEFVLRIPSLFAHILFLFFSFKLIRGFQNKWLIAASFLIINLNPYLLDFFSLSRGYALSLGLMMASIYFLYGWFVSEQKTKYAILCCIMGALATAANFVVLNYFVVSFGLIFLITTYNVIRSNRKISEKTVQFIKSIAFPVIIVFLSLWFLLPIALKLKDAGALFYGGKTGFWTDTFCTITDRCFYELGYNYWFQRAAKAFVILIVAATGFYSLMKQIKKKQTKGSSFTGVLVLLLCLCVLSTIVQHYIFDTLYLIDRTALFLVVIFSLVLVFFINEISKEISRASILIYLVSSFAVFHFILSFNLHYVLEWKWDADIKEMLVDLEKVKVIPKEKENISISIPLEFDQGINYYRAVNHLTWLNTAERSKPISLMNDYLFLGPDEYKTMNMDSVEIIKTYPGTNNILAKPRYAPNLINVSYSSTLDFEKSPQGKYIIDNKVEYAKGFEYILNDSITNNLKGEVVFKATVMAKDVSKCNLYFIISFENKDGLYLWKRVYIEDYIKGENEWVDVSFTCIVPDETRPGDKLKSYIWNPNKHTLFLKKMEFKWISNQ